MESRENYGYEFKKRVVSSWNKFRMTEGRLGMVMSKSILIIISRHFNNMEEFLKNHENFIKEKLNLPWENREELADFHLVQIQFLQHERIVHLIITIFFAVFLFAAFCLTLFFDNWLFFALDWLILVLLVPYIFHYYKLENWVQRWYRYYKELKSRQKRSVLD